ncbi:MAG: hypothetical protein O2800_03725 [Planctomycetota bacterium]|nr:hypothetical protein [Planctomycetota bacterium]
MKSLNAIVCSSFVTTLSVLIGCGDKTPAPQPATTAPTAAADDHGHDDHGHDDHGGHVPAPVVDLGSTTIGPFQIIAQRDAGAVVAGGEIAVDVDVTSTTTKAIAVRFWVGTEDAKGSMKAKADIENPTSPNRWHTHVELPSPMTSDARLWIEIETASGERSTGSVVISS